MENMYLKVKEMISVRDAAFFYGLDADCIGLYPCVIHQHDQPGMEIGDRYYYCHECRQSGDVIDLVARTFVLSRQEAAEKLILDFGLLSRNELKVFTEEWQCQKNPDQDQLHAMFVLSEVVHVMRIWKEVCLAIRLHGEVKKAFSLVCRYLFVFEDMLDRIAFGTDAQAQEMMNILNETDLIDALEQDILEGNKVHNPWLFEDEDDDMPFDENIDSEEMI